MLNVLEKIFLYYADKAILKLANLLTLQYQITLMSSLDVSKNLLLQKIVTKNWRG